MRIDSTRHRPVHLRKVGATLADGYIHILLSYLTRFLAKTTVSREQVPSRANAMSTTKGRVDNYPNLSLPFDLMKEEYDVVIVGSGYGAGVAASRMARAGKSVAVLEVGWERKRISAFDLSDPLPI